DRPDIAKLQRIAIAHIQAEQELERAVVPALDRLFPGSMRGSTGLHAAYAWLGQHEAQDRHAGPDRDRARTFAPGSRLADLPSIRRRPVGTRGIHSNDGLGGTDWPQCLGRSAEVRHRDG